MEKQLIFITGGARSGKTSFAEKSAEKIAKKMQRDLYYLATSKAKDAEMKNRIKRHQKDRKKSQANWETIEQAVNVGEAAERLSENAVVLVDCITLLLTNELYNQNFNEEKLKEKEYQNYIKERVTNGLMELLNHASYLFIVSNEVLYDPIFPENELVWVYQKLLGEIHQELVSKANKVYLLEFGIVIRKK
ncbi:MAG: bifunctional adenosylcobinamide kinase/adenosylcobinamide-phosphate guanylyltransferase [Atopostipes sp.]|nr:bifunctional adenosylcobinamide kinase/adenosylcobinamide-phosphate guanylyltransferase [Atopostipes sp.]